MDRDRIDDEEGEGGKIVVAGNVDPATRDAIADWVRDARRLRGAAAAATFDFFAYVFNGQERFRDVWPTMAKSYGKWCEHHRLCSAAAFESFRRALDEFGEDAVRKMGVDAATVIMRISPKLGDAKERALERATSFAESHDGAVYTRRGAETMVRELGVGIPKMNREHAGTSPGQLARENAALRAKVGMLTKQLATARAEVRALKARLAKKG